jgi:energy-coupling factor transport system permease protein
MNENHRDTFTSYSPVINFTFFIAAVVFGMLLLHPAFLVCSVVFSSSYYLILKGSRGLKLILGMLPVFAAVSLLNPLLNTNGTHILFTWLGGRPYTWEALCYGMALAAMFVAVILWFACYSIVMTSDKFIHMFGRMIPSLSLVLTMILRLVPSYRRKLVQISTARKCTGSAGAAADKKTRLENGMSELSALTTWAFEGGIVTADSMRSRGYGTGRRSCFSVYRFDARDRIMLGGMILLIIITAGACLAGAAAATYTPVFYIRDPGDPLSAAAIISYIIFLSIPTGVNITEAIKWRILRSRI